MSGFDFDALRDPDAPRPGGRERAGVETRARQLRSRARRNRLVMSATAIVATTATVLGVVAATHRTGPSISVEGPSTTTASSTPITSGVSAIQDRFVPPTRFEEDSVVLPVTFPDGETVTLRYPTPLKIAQLGFGGGGGVVGFSGDNSRQVALSYTTMDKAYAGTQPIKVFPNGQGGEVRLYPGKEPTLVFQFGPWLARVSDANGPMTDSQLATWARNLTGSLDPNGYLLLHAAAPLSIANFFWFDGGFGSFGAGNLVEIAAHLFCGQPASDTSAHRRYSDSSGDHVSWCDGDLHVTASGSASFVDMADKELKVSALATPLVSETTTSTTTTTAPAASSPADAVSASWVSPQHGWVLERNGRIDTTTDSGLTWRAVGTTGIYDASGTKIRFADDTRGFAFDGHSRLIGTDDGGVSWKRIATPFSSGVADLAISHGVVYAVAYTDSVDFKIWSAPVNHLVWTSDPLRLQIGAGPVPTQQFVFAGGSAWLLNVDRTVISGAELSSNGAWKTWSPPCLHVNGPANLSASTATDLVAACEEGVWGGLPKITPTVYFSHDGGATFQRRLAPTTGAVASPNPNTAVIVDGRAIQRTTDDGATWKVVARTQGQPGSAAADLGFTTSTQGFIILGSGEMLMTHDAGATWSPVTLP